MLQPAGDVEVACHLYGLTGAGFGNHAAMENDDAGVVEKIVDRMRGTGVGTEDPNIIGDAGPTDVPPGRDPDSWPPPELEADTESDPPVS